MPCESYYTGDHERATIAKLRSELDRVSKLLCRALGLSAKRSKALADEEIRRWWERHQRLDRAAAKARAAKTAKRRAKKERAKKRRELIASMKPADRRLLANR